MEAGIFYYLFAGVTALSVLGILITRNMMYAAFLLVLTFLGVAGLFVLAHAEFVAVTQILIYVGGVLILLVFGIMLTNRISGKQVLTPISRSVTGVILAGGIFVVLITISHGLNIQSGGAVASGTASVKHLGLGLLTDYIFIFELIGFLLLVALVGAATIARYKQSSER